MKATPFGTTGLPKLELTPTRKTGVGGFFVRFLNQNVTYEGARVTYPKDGY